ncbi:MAG TPA: hypothetical protein VGQ72_03290 [Pyrinomonadaceae bacterium]|jgi:hypothetical protein|nr:hypothetical protein [Pyrinomonadaceae bacterium]
MVKQLALGTILGAIVLFVWSALAWMIIPWPGEPLRSFTSEDAMVTAIKANVPRSGNYLIPNEPKRTPGMTEEQYRAAMQAAENRMNNGPMVFAAVRLEPMSMPKAMIIGFITDIVVVLLACILLLQTDRLSYKARVAVVVGLGLLIFIGGHVDEWNWWGFSTAYMLMEFGAVVIGWFLTGLVMAIFVRGKTAV